MSDDPYEDFECAQCGEPLSGDGHWCGNPDCMLGPDESDDDGQVNGEVEPVEPKDAPDGMNSHSEVTD